jgi:quercetin dioxygenase-like cupin family protein
MNYIIEGEGALVDVDGNENPLKTGDFALVHPNEKHQYRNKSANKPFVMICGVPKQYE